MGSIIFDENRTFTEDMSFEQLDSSSCNIYGDPEILPRIGDQYQVDIPPLIGESYYPLYKKNHSDVDGSNFDAWNVNQKGSFLLGVYIFEKNFVQLKRFVESKKMGDILSFYYGKFYGSREYQRWSDCRKKKRKRCVYGHKLFAGVRQQELLSRLFPSVSVECQHALSEVSKTFADGKVSLEDYVFSLKEMVGTEALVQAVGIGEGKKDLTRMAVEYSRSNQVTPMRSEIPTGKACAALEPSEIIKFLTGDYRLSKARADDLFWEAVWPRLLAKGWQSEQPKNKGNDSLVFLVPGVEKFSRRLVKGKQYFNSITDILSKVASDPVLLELDSREGKNKERKDNDEWTPETKEEQDDDMPTHKRNCYLQPQTPSRNAGGMKFKVVDTSLTNSKPYTVRELRSLPLEGSNKTTSASHTEYIEESTYEVSSDESDTITTMLVDHPKTDDVSARKDLNVIDQKWEIYSACPDSTNRPVSGVSNIKILYKNKLKRNNIDYIYPVTKRRRRLTACSRAEAKVSSIVSISGPEMPSCCSGRGESASYGLSPPESSSTSSQGFQTEGIECASVTDARNVEFLDENLQTRILIDLNVPPVTPDFESGVFTSELTEKQVDQSHQKPKDQNAVKISPDMATSGRKCQVIERRHSTRTRPPTARALEALANGFLKVNSRPRKNKEISSRTSGLPSVGAGVADLSISSSTESPIDECGSRMCYSGSSNACSKFRVM